MQNTFTLEYWMDDDWFVGRLPAVPGVFSQGETLADLQENIRDAYQMMVETSPDPLPSGVEVLKTELAV